MNNTKNIGFLSNGVENSSSRKSGEDSILFTSNYIIMYSAAVLCVVVTIGGNFLVLMSFRFEKKIRTVSNYYIFSLALADMGVGLFSMSIYVFRYIVTTPPLDLEPVGPVICYSYLTLDHLLTHVSIFNIIAIGFDRFLSIEDPMRYRAQRTSLKVKKVILYVWLGCLLFWFIVVFVWPAIVKGFQYEQEFCTPYYEDSFFGSILAALVYFWIPTPILCGLYFKLYRTSARMKKNMSQNMVVAAEPRPREVRRPTLSSVNLSYDAKTGPNISAKTAAAAAVELSGATIFVIANESADENIKSVFGNELNRSPRLGGRLGLSSPRAGRKKPISPSQRRADMKMNCNGFGDDRKISFAQTTSASTRKISSMIVSVASMAEAQNKKAFKAFTFILGALIITWTPWASLVIVRALFREDKTFLERTNALFNFSYFFTYINSTVNPLCYALASRTFANAFYRILCCRFNNKSERSISLNSLPGH